MLEGKQSHDSASFSSRNQFPEGWDCYNTFICLSLQPSPSTPPLGQPHVFVLSTQR